ncbi:MAG: ATP-binding protein [Terriglobia bacterium]|jgi:hypothetical protein
MKTILKVLGLASAARDESEIVQLVDDESERCATSGDMLGAGEWYVSRLDYSSSDEAGPILAKVIALWASPVELNFAPADLKDLVGNLHQFNPDEIVTAAAGLLARRSRGIERYSNLLNDLEFRISEDVERIFGIKHDRPSVVLTQAAAVIRIKVDASLEALRIFNNSKGISAREAAIELIKKNRQLKALLLLRERPVLSEVEMLLGNAFRSFCQAYERGETDKVLSHVDEIRQQARQTLQSDTHANSVVWHLLVRPLAEHVVTLTDEASRAFKLAAAPALKLATDEFKVDLSRVDTSLTLSARLVNEGSGDARKIRFSGSNGPVSMRIISPRDAFDIAGRGEGLIGLEFSINKHIPSLIVPIEWHCFDITGEMHKFPGTIRLEQQRGQPNWDTLLDDPPYSVNPIRARDRLFGREAHLTELLLNSAGGTSTFVWGQKRVGKTSLLQVLGGELLKRSKFACVYLRMGELLSMHEGQIAHAIATRLLAILPDHPIPLPSEGDFGASLGRLVPFIENLSRALPGWRLVAIIDEFDDLDPAFYTGERGRIFVKALRSLSEIGLTFFFAGSERMNVIYAKHALELNKWNNMFLDSIASRQDCRDLITRPLLNVIDYAPLCVDKIAEYCRGNPFFMHLVCQALFKRCLADRRTFVSDADLGNELNTLSETLGMTNFAHLWEDNQILDKDENSRFAAENCLMLCCVAALRGAFQSPEEIWEQQDTLNLTSTERLSVREISMVIERLRARKIISDPQPDRHLRLQLPVFSDWLAKNAELNLLPIWRKFCAHRAELSANRQSDRPAVMVISQVAFPISEDELLSVSQNLLFCGKQKDVAEIRSWLRQFDDDNRIEIAFLLLKRLSERGYISDGAREYSISKITDAVNARRLEIGAGKWNVIRGRKDNLCISYVDSDLKSGANLARELMKWMNPTKAGDAKEVSYWLKSRLDQDPMLILVDDFSGTGSTISKGLRTWKTEVRDRATVDKLLNEGRVMFAILYAFGEALEEVRKVDARIKVFASNTLGHELRAFDPEANIFGSSQEIDFARTVMLQIGRELTPQFPLGYGEQASLIVFHNTVPNNTLPIFWSNGRVNERGWRPLFSRA